MAYSQTISLYKKTMREYMHLYDPRMPSDEINKLLEYSIQKRFYNAPASIDNSYTNKSYQTTLLAVADYIASREPIVTAFGTMFKKHADSVNPMAVVIQSFLDKRSAHKAEMFKYPKGSEMFEKYNLLQSLDKIDTNGLYGTIGQYSSLIYNNNVATSVTTAGRSMTASMTLHFEMFLADNVKFGSLNEVLAFINNVVKENNIRRFNDADIIDEPVKINDCFAKIILDCGYRWIPTEDEMEIIYTTIANLGQEDLNRVYYKNNLYEFVSNTKVLNLVLGMIKNLDAPVLNSLDIPDVIKDDMALFTDLLMEYVYYRYLYIDRIDRCDNMIKSITMISDTDSTIISLDAWYRFIAKALTGSEIKIGGGRVDEDETKVEPRIYQYIDYSDETTEIAHQNDPTIMTADENVKYTIVNLLANVLDRTVNDYMEKCCENAHSFTKDKNSKYYRPCKIHAKTEFYFKRVMMTKVKKNYASLIGVQEGNLVPENKQLDIKGIEALTKSTKSISTRKALQKILYEDILNAPKIDQIKFVKDIQRFENQIIQSLRSGSREYYKPATIKSADTYDDPMKIQGIKASIVWNNIKTDDLPAIDLSERNGVDIAKVKINKETVEDIKDKYPEVYQNALKTLEMPEFKDKKEIDAIAIPRDMKVPEWINEFLDYTAIVNDNIGGFPYESIGIQNFGIKELNYTNIVQL